ncbi:MAG: sulfite exporter TauE/SafE family protein [Pseudomonadota bacterium]
MPIWLSADVLALIATAASIGVLHTAIGPDHYVPFAALARARGWSAVRTAAITAACGLVHIAGSVLLGLVGVAFGLALESLTGIELWRGNLAAWLLLSFGLVYMVWGMRRANRQHSHAHVHTHADGVVHSHAHDHAGDHGHIHAEQSRASLAPWALFLIFAFGPCEALIPLLMYPAATHHVAAIVAVCAAFAIATLVTMQVLVLMMRWGLNRIDFSHRAFAGAARHVNTFAGALISVCALAMLVGL